MKKIILVLFGLFFHNLQAKFPVAFFSTENLQEDSYFAFFKLLEHWDLEPTLYSMPDILDLDPDDFALGSYKVHFFYLSREWLSNLSSDKAKNFLELCRFSIQDRGSLRVFFLPQDISRSMLNKFIDLVYGWFVDHDLSELKSQLFVFISQLWSRNNSFETALKPASDVAVKTSVIQDLESRGARFFPNVTNFDRDIFQEVDSVHPLVFSPEDKGGVGSLYFAKNFIPFFGSVNEDFHTFPLEEESQEAVFELCNNFVSHLRWLSDGKQQNRLNKNILTLRQVYNLEPFYDSFGDQKFAWMELELFRLGAGRLGHIKNLREKRQTLINYILDSSLDGVWLSATPNYYYSPIAIRKNEKKSVVDAYKKFYALLTEAAKKRGLEVPKVFVGIEIANNLYKPNLPSNFTQDIYGGQFKDLPSPLDRSFWITEVISPVSDLMLDLGQEVPISGVILDLEMYGRQSYGLYPSLIGFSDLIKQNYLNFMSVDKEVFDYLQADSSFKNYFDYLGDQARDLGVHLAEELTKMASGLQLGVYLPTVPMNWFYPNFLQGFSSLQTIDLFTFLTRFDLYKSIFIKNNIDVRHHSALMLSKMKSTEDFASISEVTSRNDGVWLNRFSRLVEPYAPKQWYAVEQTPMDSVGKNGLTQFLGSL